MLDNRWMELCVRAAEEQDSVKLLALTQEISRLLEEKAQWLKGTHHESGPMLLMGWSAELRIRT